MTVVPRDLQCDIKIRLLTACIVLVLIHLSAPGNAVAGIALDCEGSVRALALQGYNCSCSGGQLVCDGAKTKGSSKASSHGVQMKSMIVGAVFESLLSSLFSPPAISEKNEKEKQIAQQRAAELTARYLADKHANEAAAQAAFDTMMQSYKRLDGGDDVQFKSLSEANLAFKTLDGDLESLAAGARKPFDASSAMKSPHPEPPGNATPFFGDIMPQEDINLLVTPGNDPRVVDLRSAHTYLFEQLENDREKLASPAQADARENSRPMRPPDECRQLAQKLNRFIAQREKFHKTVLLSQDQVLVWENANRNALVNAAKDGMEYFAGIWLDMQKNRGLAADRLRRVYEQKAGEMARDGLDVVEIGARIRRLKLLSDAGSFAGNANNANDWQTFVKDVVSSMVAQLTSSNQEIREMLEDPKIGKFFTTEAPELSALLDIAKISAANKVFGKWVARKVPIIAAVEISTKQLYNATDWYLSFNRISEANNINGKVMESARYLHNKIDAAHLELSQCP